MKKRIFQTLFGLLFFVGLTVSLAPNESEAFADKNTGPSYESSNGNWKLCRSRNSRNCTERQIGLQVLQ